MIQILLVEDDIKIAGEIVENLEKQNFLVTHVRTIAQTSTMTFSQFSLLIFDWNLPDGEGIDLVRALRKKDQSTPILMLTAKTQLESRTEAIEAGVNDFLGKPFFYHELEARVTLLINKTQAPTAKVSKDELEQGPIKVIISERAVLFKDQPVKVTKKEFDLLVFLMKNPKAVFTRDEILDAVWGSDTHLTNRTVDTHILQLRKKLGSESFETVWSTGYRFIPAND